MADRSFTTGLAALAGELASEDVTRLCTLLVALNGPPARGARMRLLEAVPTQRLRDRFVDLLDAWATTSSQIPGPAVALGLETAHEAAQARAADQGVELVWTGPASAEVPVRRTDQVLLELIRSSTTSLWLVSFAVNRVPAVLAAVREAVARRVLVNLVLESVEASEGRLSFDQIEAISRTLAGKAAIYGWPPERRPRNEDGKRGVLHAKCAIADDSRLFVSSANLTEFAMSLNMEVGLLVKGGHVPWRIGQHLGRLVEEGVLERVAVK